MKTSRSQIEGAADAQRVPDGRRVLGKRGEDEAAAYLEQQGYAIVVRNWR
ncbi:MAG: hypothetical protein QG637_834, partial [Chloroflexota bacterium]|nr:hypothetical protein [Chloroflexota bacterium]